MAKKTTKKATPRGNAGNRPNRTPTRVERESRLRVVERCISIGIYDAESIQTELRAQGHEVSLRATYAYIRKVRVRLADENAELRALRRAILIRDTQRYERVIFGKLMDSSTKPKWKDLVAVLKIRQLVEAGRYEDITAMPITLETEGEIDSKTAEELDEMIVAMLNRSGVPQEIVPPEAKEDSLH